MKKEKNIAKTLGTTSFSCKTVCKTIRYLNYPGAQVIISNEGQAYSYGTLGGFLSSKSPRKFGKLYAVTAGHVSRDVNNITLKTESVSKLGEFLGKWEQNPDINVAKIYKDHNHRCDLKLRDDKDNRMECILLDLEREENKNATPGLIHIKGASSGIGLGEIQAVNFFVEGGHGNCMLARDRKGEEKPFCKPGDSGALVCSNDRHGQFVNVLGMVIGEYTSTEENYRGYLVYHFQSGLTHLNNTFAKEGPFELCESYSE